MFPREFLRRLVGSRAAQAFLIDEGFADAGEEVKIDVQNDRVIALGQKAIPFGVGSRRRGDRLLLVWAGGRS